MNVVKTGPSLFKDEETKVNYRGKTRVQDIEFVDVSVPSNSISDSVVLITD